MEKNMGVHIRFWASVAVAVGWSVRVSALSDAPACDWSGASWIGDGKPQPTNDAAFYATIPRRCSEKRSRSRNG
jgi:hypothetical protein